MSKNRFSDASRLRFPDLFRVIFMAGVGAAVILGGAGLSEALSVQSQLKEKETLEQALERGAVSYYACKGMYPAGLEELADLYGITWDPTRFLVDFEPVAENLPPDITVMDLRDH